MLSSILIFTGLFGFQEAGAEPPKPKLECLYKFAVPGRKIKLALTLPSAPGEGAKDSLELKGEKTDSPVKITPPEGAVIREASAGGAQKRTIDWTVPELPSGKAELYWRVGETAVGPVSLQILKEEKRTDWSEASVGEMQKAAVLIYTEKGDMLAEMVPDKAPETVRNFLKLASEKFYDGLIWHRIWKDFMIQGGDPNGNGQGDPGYRIAFEKSDIQHKKGVLSMARQAAGYDTAGSQFFIVHKRWATWLDGEYAAFGKLLDGYDTLDRLADLPVSGDAKRPDNPPTMQITVVEKP